MLSGSSRLLLDPYDPQGGLFCRVMQGAAGQWTMQLGIYGNGQRRRTEDVKVGL